MSEMHLAVPGGIIVVDVPDDAPDTGDGSSWLHRLLNMGGRVVRVEPCKPLASFRRPGPCEHVWGPASSTVLGEMEHCVECSESRLVAGPCRTEEVP